MNTTDPDPQMQKLAERYYNSLEDQLYDPDPEVDGYDKDHQKRYIVELLTDLARDAVNLVAAKGLEEG